MKKFLAVVAVLAVASAAFAVDKITGEVIRDYNNNPIQGFSPNPDYTRTVALGTKTLGNYSTNIGGSALPVVSAVRFSCRQVGTTTTVPVRVGLNGSVSNFILSDSDTFVIRRSVTKVTFQPWSSATSVNCGVFGH